ncbi:MAG: serine/threonine protein kinase [Deltaproteobacteria bacterium]|nr:serine/threonine protein kinase [Deltaproteobacteria bacterium]
MGAVYQATQLDLARAVAVKVLLDLDPRGAARLRQEALTAGGLSCPYIVSIFDFQSPPGEPPFVVMELLAGESLAAALERQRALPVDEACRIAIEALIGLDFAHRAGVVHRDIKPSNIWLSSGRGMEGHVKLLDFGIAKYVADAEGVQTTTGSLLGTPAYLSPEQLRGHEAGDRSDQHAIGLVLFEMLTGSRPWRSQGVALFAEVLERVPPMVTEAAPHVPFELARIIARALAKDPLARFANADELRQALVPFARGSALASSYPSMPPPAAVPQVSSGVVAGATTAGRGTTIALVVALVALVVVIPVTAFGVYYLTRTDPSAGGAPSLASSPRPASGSASSSAVGTAPPAPSSGPAPSAVASAQPKAASGGAKKSKCLCLDARSRLVCPRALVPRCSCENPSTICPVPTDAHGDCPARNNFGAFTGPGLKSGATCNGFVNEGGKAVPASGKLSCLACYGQPKEAAVPGTVCKGMREGTEAPDFSREGLWVCD